MQTPQEIEVWYILPAIRKTLTIELKSMGVSQKKIAYLLGVTEAAVSQYKKNKRANEISFPKDIQVMIKKAADSMTSTKKCHRYEIENLLKSIRKDGMLCTIHRKYDDVPKCCHVCTG